MLTDVVRGILVGVGSIAAAGSLYASDIKDSLVSHIPLIDVSKVSAPAPVQSQDVVTKGSSVEFNIDAGYKVPRGFYFDPHSMVLRTNSTENGEFVRKPDGNIMYQFSKDFDAYDVLEYCDEFNIDRDVFLEEARKVFYGGDIKDFNLSGKTLEEIVGVFKKIDEYSELEWGEDFLKYGIDLDVEAEVNVSAVSENRLFADGYDVLIKKGSFAWGRAIAGADVNMSMYLDKEDLSGRAEVGFSYFTNLDIGEGDFTEFQIGSPGGFFLGAGEINKKGKIKSISKEYFAGVSADVYDLSGSAEIWEKSIKEEVDVEEDIAYLLWGVDRDSFWVSRSFGHREIRKKGFREVIVEGDRSDFGRGGLEDSLDSEKVEDISEESSDFIHSTVANFKVLNAGGLEVDVYGYLNSHFDERGIGASFLSDWVSGISDSAGDYFGAVSLFGRGGDFDGDFRRMKEMRSSFLDNVRSNVRWDDKSWVYLFANRDGDEEEVGGFVGSEGLHLIGGSIVKDDANGFFAEIGGNKFSVRLSEIEGEHKNSAVKKLDTRFNFEEYYAHVVAECVDKNESISFKIGFPF